MSFDLKIKSGDLSIENGDLQIAMDTEKLIQDLLKICVSSTGSNPLHPWYGSMVSKTMIGSPLASDIVIQICKVQIENAVKNLKAMQEAQSRQFQKMSPFEQINYIMDISVFRSNKDFRFFSVHVKVLSKGLKPITTSFDITTI